MIPGDHPRSRMLRDPFILAGVAGLLGALLIGIAEFAMQFNPDGGYGARDYGFFNGISGTRLAFGHFLAVFAAPLYVAGYWHLGQAFSRGGSKFAGPLVALAGSYAFIVANAWIGGRIYIARTVHALAEAGSSESRDALTALLDQFRGYNEPLVNALRIAIVVVSVVWIVQVLRRRTIYPRWMAIANPATILGTIFLVYLAWPALGVWLLPAAMNVTHVVVFGLSVGASLHTRTHSGHRP